jgi:hypothetical protein
MRILLTLCLFFCSNLVAFAQKPVDARAAAMGFSNAADTRGVAANRMNPATLALPTGLRFEVNLFSAMGTVNNNSFSKSQYDRYFTTGALLSPKDVQNILEAIPSSGLNASLIANSNALSIFFPGFSFSAFLTGSAMLNIPKDGIALPLNGNVVPGQSYLFNDLSGSQWSGLGVSIAAAHSVRWDKLPIKDLLLGISLTYYKGFSYTEIENAKGNIQNYDLTDFPYLRINGQLAVLAADGGRGAAFSFGGIAQINDQFSLGFSFLNPISQMTWQKNAERRIYEIHGDSIALPFNLDSESLQKTEIRVDLSSFSTRLPAVMDWALVYRSASQTTLSLEYEQGFTEQMGGTRRPRIAAGVEYWPVALLPLRGGISIGGINGASWSIGSGIHFRHWYLDAAFINHRKILPGDFKGIGLAITSRLRF